MIPKDMNVKVTNIRRDSNGRFLILEVCIEDTCYVIVNTYAPTKDKLNLQLNFIDELSEILCDYLENRIIWGGDLNTYLQPDMDKKGGTHEAVSEYALRILGLMEHYDLVDIWRVRNPEGSKYTWIRRTRAGIVQSRIDYFLVSSCITNIVKKIDIVPGIRSDHSMLCLSINPDKSDARGKGFWKFNASLLKDKEYVEQVKSCIRNVKTENECIENKGLLWDLIKCKIRGLTVSYSVRKRLLDNSQEKDLVKEIEVKEQLLASGDTNVMKELEILKAKYESIQEVKVQGIIVRSKAIAVEQGEKKYKIFSPIRKTQS